MRYPQVPLAQQRAMMVGLSTKKTWDVWGTSLIFWWILHCSKHKHVVLQWERMMIRCSLEFLTNHLTNSYQHQHFFRRCCTWFFNNVIIPGARQLWLVSRMRENCLWPVTVSTTGETPRSHWRKGTHFWQQKRPRNLQTHDPSDWPINLPWCRAMGFGPSAISVMSAKTQKERAQGWGLWQSWLQISQDFTWRVINRPRWPPNKAPVFGSAPLIGTNCSVLLCQWQMSDLWAWET